MADDGRQTKPGKFATKRCEKDSGFCAFLCLFVAMLGLGSISVFLL